MSKGIYEFMPSNSSSIRAIQSRGSRKTQCISQGIIINIVNDLTLTAQRPQHRTTTPLKQPYCS